MNTALRRTLARSIKAKLTELGPWYLQKHYLRESTHLVRSWFTYIEPHHELAAWAMAKDFEKRFPRHSYAEWAYVFGIPRDHSVVRSDLRPMKLEERRRQQMVQSVQTRSIWFVIAYVIVFWSLVIFLVK